MGSTSSREQWETVALAALERKRKALDSSDPKPAASSHLRGQQSFKAPVHCELSLQFFISSRKTSKAPPHLCSTSAFRSPRVLYVGTFFTAYGEDVLWFFLPELHMGKHHFRGSFPTWSSPGPSIEGALRQFTKSSTPTWLIDMQSAFCTTGNCLGRCLKRYHEQINCTVNMNSVLLSQRIHLHLPTDPREPISESSPGISKVDEPHAGLFSAFHCSLGLSQRGKF